MSTPKTQSAEKHAAIRKLLFDEHLLAHINPGGDGVNLPARLMGNPTVTLKLSKLFRGRVELLEDRIEAELLFGGEYFTCIIPLAAVWGVTSSTGKNTFWLDSAPAGLVENVATTSEKSMDVNAAPRPQLAADPRAETLETKPEDKSVTGKNEAPVRPVLRRVK